MARTENISSLEFVRSIAFMMVFFSHIDNFGINGGGGVSIFLVLSGFLMRINYYDKTIVEHGKTNSLLKEFKGACKFSGKKISKLYVLHILMIPLAMIFTIYNMVIINKVPAMEIVNTLFKQIMANIFLVQAWIPSMKYAYSLNGVAWYLSVCVFIYFLFPYINERIGREKKKSFFYIAITIMLMGGINFSVSHMLPEHSYWFSYISPVVRMLDFYIGCQLGNIWLCNERKTIQARYQILAIVSILLTHYAFARGYINDLGPSLSFLPSSMFFVYAFSRESGKFNDIVSNKWIVWFSGLTPYMYLIHQVVIKYLKVLNLSGVLLIISSICITLICAVVYVKVSRGVKNRICQM